MHVVLPEDVLRRVERHTVELVEQTAWHGGVWIAGGYDPYA